MSKIISLTEEDHYQRWSAPDYSNAESSPQFVSDFAKNDDFNDVGRQVSNQNSSVDISDADIASTSSSESLLMETQNAYKEKADGLSKILQAMANPLERVNAAVERELVELSVAIAKFVLRREIEKTPEDLLGIAQAAIKQLPAASLNIEVHLHPEDVQVVNEILESTEKSDKWVLKEDPALNRGDCHIITDTSFIDAGVDSLVERIAKDMLGTYNVTDFSGTATDESS